MHQLISYVRLCVAFSMQRRKVIVYLPSDITAYPYIIEGLCCFFMMHYSVRLEAEVFITYSIFKPTVCGCILRLQVCQIKLWSFFLLIFKPSVALMCYWGAKIFQHWLLQILLSLGILTDVWNVCWYYQTKIYVMLNKSVDRAREMSFHLLQDIKTVQQPICHSSSGYPHSSEHISGKEIRSFRSEELLKELRGRAIARHRFEQG